MTATAAPAATARNLLAEAEHLALEVRALAAWTEAERKLPASLVEAFIEAGLFHMLVPESLGGLETDPITAARVVETIARADGSAGWVVMLAGQNAAEAAFLAPNEARSILVDGGNVAGTARPIGRAVAVEAPEPGYLVDGRWPFASGSSHATWFVGECIIYDGDEPRRDEHGDRVVLTVFVPRCEVTVHDNWDPIGLRGTASNDFTIARAFVPAGRTFTRRGQPRHPWAAYRAFPLFFMTHGAQALGVARAAIDEASAIIGERIGWGGVPLAETPRHQAALAEATATVEAARAYLYATADELWAAAQADAVTPELRAALRLATSHAVTSSVRAIDLLHRTLATSAIHRGSAIERQFRDIHTAAAHVMVGPLTYEAAGRVQLGGEANFAYF
jgi:alkylation response protein AidB-like acyl-CoA dehydrogenase